MGDDGLFIMPSSISSDDEVKFAKVRMDSIRLSSYADTKCGLSNTFDKTGAYLCGGRKDGSSSPCNKNQGTLCLILSHPLSDKNHQSCGFWETKNAGDIEVKYCPEGKFDDKRAQFGGTDSDLGFSCSRCEYGEGKLSMPDSEGRQRWCALKGMPVEDNACCADNEPDDDSEGDE